MIPRIAKQGHSFKGAGLYYLHDKKSQTKDRVDWTHTVNLPTNNPEKGLKVMAWTAMNSNRLKQQSGIAPTGRKKITGPVYSFSLSWHPKQNPDKETMMNAAFETLKLLRLQEHEAVLVAHNDTPHPHVHVICNLIHPETGRKAVMSYDRLIMSQWAEGVEKSDGEILCEQRVINNEKRRNGFRDEKHSKIVKHREIRLKRAQLIQSLYEKAGNGKAFKSALEYVGYTLAKGDSRGFVLVDKSGEIFSLSRQLKGQGAKDINQRLQDVKEIPFAKKLSEERKYFDRDKYETERQKKIVDAAIEFNQAISKKTITESKNQTPSESEEFLRKLDEIRNWEQIADRQRSDLEQKLKDQYKREELLKEIKEKEKLLSEANKAISGIFKRKEILEQINTLKLNLANADQRMKEQREALEIKIQKTKPTIEQDIKNQRREDIQRRKQHREPPNNLDKGPDPER